VTRAEYVAGLRRTLEWPELDEDTALQGDERWDSLAQVDAVMYTQDALGQTLSAEGLQKARTLRDLVALVETELAAP
jgi:acyl carrier protein